MAMAATAQGYPERDVDPSSTGFLSSPNSFHEQLLEDSMASVTPVIAWITAQCRREALSKDGIGAQIYAEADAGHVTHEEAALLVRSLLSAGLDTTIFGISNALHCFASNPEQWRCLRENLALARPAFEEVIRYAAPVQTFFRTTTKPVEVAGVCLDEGQKVLLFLAAANRDPRKWQDPDKFDIRRKTLGHGASAMVFTRVWGRWSRAWKPRAC